MQLAQLCAHPNIAARRCSLAWYTVSAQEHRGMSLGTLSQEADTELSPRLVPPASAQQRDAAQFNKAFGCVTV